MSCATSYGVTFMSRATLARLLRTTVRGRTRGLSRDSLTDSKLKRRRDRVSQNQGKILVLSRSDRHSTLPQPP